MGIFLENPPSQMTRFRVLPLPLDIATSIALQGDRCLLVRSRDYNLTKGLYAWQEALPQIAYVMKDDER